MKPSRFMDNSVAPIIAFDFDETICIGSYPDPYKGSLRAYAKEVINFLVDIGVKVVVWTSRDVAINQDKFEVYDDLTSMVNWLNDNGVNYSAINKSIQFAPFHYNGRKIYAHMYVDDRAYGWDNDNDYIMLDILVNILVHVIGVPNGMAGNIVYELSKHGMIGHHDREYVINAVRKWVK